MRRGATRGGDRDGAAVGATDGHRAGTPHGQMLRYLTTADIASEGRIRFGILTSGSVWRLYDRRARPLATGFFEADLADLLQPLSLVATAVGIAILIWAYWPWRNRRVDAHPIDVKLSMRQAVGRVEKAMDGPKRKWWRRFTPW